MKHLFLSIICLCISFLSCFAQQSLKDPLYLGSLLIDRPDVKAMASLCQDYNLTEIPSTDEYKTYKYPDGTLIKFSIIPDSLIKNKPYVEIHTTASKRDIERILREAGFNKHNGIYEKGYHGALRFSTCKIIGNKNKQVIFTKEKGIF